MLQLLLYRAELFHVSLSSSEESDCYQTQIHGVLFGRLGRGRQTARHLSCRETLTALCTHCVDSGHCAFCTHCAVVCCVHLRTNSDYTAVTVSWYILRASRIVACYSSVVTICTALWSQYVPHCGHYMYRTVVTICTAQWSLYVPHSGQYMYRTVVTICTAQWSLYVPHCGHYMYRTVVTICTAL